MDKQTLTSPNQSVDASLLAYNQTHPDVSRKIANPCATPNRSGPFTLSNQSQWTVEIMFMQLKSDLNPLPPGYTSDTGTFVAAMNVGAGGSHPIDPCLAGGLNKPIYANWMQYNAKLFIYAGGERREHDMPAKTVSSPSGQYFGKGTIRIIPGLTATDGSEPPQIEVDFSAEQIK